MFFNKLKNITNGIIYLIVLFLLVVIYFKNDKINNLKTDLNKKPKIEYIPQIVRDTVTDSIPVPYKVTEWKDSVIYVDNTVYKPIDLTRADSAKIAREYIKILHEYSETKHYSNVLKDDSLAFIKLDEKARFNTVFDRKLTYEHRTPVVRITHTETDKTSSVVGGLSGNFNGIDFGTGFVTRRNLVYLVSYDPFSKAYKVHFYTPVFNF